MRGFIDKNRILVDSIFTQNSTEDNLISFFKESNYLIYVSNFDNINEVQQNALKFLFTDTSDLETRAQKAIDINKTCYEAYYILNYITDSLTFYYQSLDIQNTPIDNFDNDYEINDVINTKLLISYFYSSINNYHHSLKYLEEVENEIGIEPISSRKMIVYSFLEDYKSINQLYESIGFNDPSQYIIFIVCLLKNGEKDLARDVYDDMLSKYKYADYLHKPQELSSIKDSDAEKMLEAMETCFDIIESIPYFFSWISECIDSKSGLAN